MKEPYYFSLDTSQQLTLQRQSRAGEVPSEYEARPTEDSLASFLCVTALRPQMLAGQGWPR